MDLGSLGVDTSKPVSNEEQSTRYRVIITVTSAVRTPAGSVPAPLKGARARPGGSDASPMLKAGPAGYSESPAFRRTKRDRVGPRGSRERARGVYQTYQATGGPSILVVGLKRGMKWTSTKQIPKVNTTRNNGHPLGEQHTAHRRQLDERVVCL